MKLVKELFKRYNNVRPLCDSTYTRTRTDDFSSTEWILEVAYTKSANIFLLSQYMFLRLLVRQKEVAINVFLVQSFISLLKWEMQSVVSLLKKLPAKEPEKSFRI